MSIEHKILDTIGSSGPKGMTTPAIVQAHAPFLKGAQVQNALRRLRRQSRIEYVGSRGWGRWRLLRRGDQP